MGELKKWEKMGGNGGKWEEIGVHPVPNICAWCGWGPRVPLSTRIGGGIIPYQRLFVASG